MESGAMGLFIIGQMGRGASAVIGGIRAPAGLPEFLFETQWAYWVTAAVIGGVLVYLGRKKGDSRLGKAGVGVLGVTVLWVVSALLLTTAGERLYAVHTDLADAAQKGDVERILSHLAPHFTATAMQFSLDAPGKDAKEEIKERLKTYGIKDTHITAYKSTRNGMNALTTIVVLTQTEYGYIKTGWELSWDDVTGEDWEIVHAKLTHVNNEAVREDRVLN